MLPKVDPARGLEPKVVDEAEDFETFLRWSFVASQLVALIVLALYAWRGTRFTRESAAGRIGTGMLLGMIGLALVWISQLPFQLLELWWQRRHELWNAGYLDWFLESWIGLGAEFLFVCFWLLITMALAAVLRKTWWLVAGPSSSGSRCSSPSSIRTSSSRARRRPRCAEMPWSLPGASTLIR